MEVGEIITNVSSVDLKTYGVTFLPPNHSLIASYEKDPSNDAIIVKGKNENVEISEYDEVIVSATVWSTMPNDLSADFYYTSTPEDPAWTFIDTLTTSKNGEAEVLQGEPTFLLVGYVVLPMFAQLFICFCQSFDLTVNLTPK